MTEIMDTFNVTPIKIETTDWDLVETTLSKILKSKAAAADYKPEFGKFKAQQVDQTI